MLMQKSRVMQRHQSPSHHQLKASSYCLLCQSLFLSHTTPTASRETTGDSGNVTVWGLFQLVSDSLLTIYITSPHVMWGGPFSSAYPAGDGTLGDVVPQRSPYRSELLWATKSRISVASMQMSKRICCWLGHFLFTPTKDRLEPVQLTQSKQNSIPGGLLQAHRFSRTTKPWARGGDVCAILRDPGLADPAAHVLGTIARESAPGQGCSQEPLSVFPPVKEQWAARRRRRSPATGPHGQAAQHRLHCPGHHHHCALHFDQRHR